MDSKGICCEMFSRRVNLIVSSEFTPLSDDQEHLRCLVCVWDWFNLSYAGGMEDSCKMLLHRGNKHSG